ncbi:unnamed protein product, partial [Meganyctiphanes norvegica]
MKKMGRGRRLLLGVLVLLLVDIIWVASSELTEFIFNESGFNKPFFSTYLKTSMFMVYLLGFLVWTPWRHQCIYQNHHNDQDYQVVDTGEDEEDGLASPDRRLTSRERLPNKPIFTVSQYRNHVASGACSEVALLHMVLWRYLPLSPSPPSEVLCKQQVMPGTNYSCTEESESKYVPIKVTDTEKHSDAESDDSSVKSVKFSKLTE